MSSTWPEERHEGAVVEFGLGGEAPVAVGQVGIGDEAVRCLGCCDPRQREFHDRAVLEGSEGALGATAGLGRVGGDVFDAELVQGAPDLGRPVPVHLADGVGGVEVAAAGGP